MDKEAVIKHVRGLLITSKHPMTLHQINNEYQMIIGKKIPYQNFGFPNLESFLRSSPDLAVHAEHNQLVVRAVTKSTSAHIVQLKRSEKTSTKKKTQKSIRYRPVEHTRWNPRRPQKNDRKKYVTNRPSAVAHNQFLDYHVPSVSSKIVVPDYSTFGQSNNSKKVVPPRFQKQNSVSNRLNIEKQEPKLAINNNDKNHAVDNISPGTSRRKTITRMMSEINLDRDSGNSSPVNDITSPILSPILPFRMPEFIETGDPKTDLQNLVDMYKLGSIDVSTILIPKRIKIYSCKIQIGNHKYTSYPEEFKTEAEAELYCYKEAFKDLYQKCGKRKSLVVASDKDILDRIPKMLRKHTGGIWEWQLQMDYTEKYQEQLPEDWLKIIDTSPCIHIQKVVNNYTLRHCKPEEVLQKGANWINSILLTSVSVPANTIVFREDGKLLAEVEFIVSANEVWCRQIGTEESDKYIDMLAEMEEYYNKHKSRLNATEFNQNGYYVAEYEDGCWCRVRAVGVYENEVSCFCIDYGDEIVLNKSKLYVLKRMFAVCQAQVFVCRLAGLEELYELSAESTTLREYFLNKQCVLEVAQDYNADDDKDDILPVYMYSYDTGECINKELLQLLTIESASPNLTKDAITEVYISDVAENGDVYVQVRSQGYNNLQQLLEELEAQIFTNPPVDILEPITKANCGDRMFLAKYTKDGHWYRVKVIDWSPKCDMAQIYYVDYGNTDVITVKKTVLYPLDKLNDLLDLYPPQAVRTKMMLDKIPSDFLAVTAKLMPKDDPVLIKIVGISEDGTPVAEFFRRNADGALLCINKSIAIESEMKKSDNTPVKITRKLSPNADIPKNVPSGGKLQCPALPSVRQTFQVHIPFAVNPYNFFVQPLESRVKLNKMMERLQDRYKSVDYSPLTIDQIVPGNIYASKYDDGVWYRTSVIKVIHNGSISVFYCDFGYYSNLTLQQLIPLDVEFMELPYQAIKAKLVHIKPKHTNWTMEHCDDFKEMVEKKNFYSVLVNITKDQLYDSDIVLELLLIDTSLPDDDVFIHCELINKGIAVEA